MGVTRDAWDSPRQGSSRGWPLVLYFHHVHPTLKHYTALDVDDFSYALETVLRMYGPSLDPGLLSKSLDQLQLKRPHVLITFDDGYRDNLEYALPILADFGVKALFFVITGRIGQVHDMERNPWKEYLSWDELRDMQKEGHVIGAHTVSHPKLGTLSDLDVQQEMGDSISEIGNQLGVSPVHFAYPYGIVPLQSQTMPLGTLAFGTVRALARPWDEEPHNIRRTYLPTGETNEWATFCEGWVKQWYESP